MHMDDLINYDRVVLPTSDDCRIRNPARIAYFRTQTASGNLFRLNESETWWRDHYKILLSHGYQLRPRFHPDWRPTWMDTDFDPFACEDVLEHLRSKAVMDAKRLSDGLIVAIKRCYFGDEEARISQMLSSPDRLRDPTNHCVPILDHFRDEEEGIDFLVMPLLRHFNDPPFSYVDEAVDFMRQTLEGLVYIHTQDVAHRDLSDGNVMMDGRPMYPRDGFHPSYQMRSARNFLNDAKYKTRSATGPINYYITDFGESSYFEDPTETRLVTGDLAQDQDVPELAGDTPYDPFAVDVFTLGMVYKRNFLDLYENLSFLTPVVDNMIQLNPAERPLAKEALAHFKRIIDSRHGITLRWRLRPAKETFHLRLVHDIFSVLREIFHDVKIPIHYMHRLLNMLLFPLKNAHRILLYNFPSR